jgi:hypothetical protein
MIRRQPSRKSQSLKAKRFHAKWSNAKNVLLRDGEKQWLESQLRR